VDVDAEEMQWVRVYPHKHTYYREVAIGEVESESIRKSIDDMQECN